MAKRAKHQGMTLSYQDAKKIEECARFSGYSLGTVYQKIGEMVLERLGLDPMEAVAYFPACQGRRVTISIDTLNLNGMLTGKQNPQEDEE